MFDHAIRDASSIKDYIFCQKLVYTTNKKVIIFNQVMVTKRALIEV